MLEELFCAHRAELTAYCRGLCRSDAAAQDIDRKSTRLNSSHNA